jgi:hypothetical protein
MMYVEKFTLNLENTALKLDKLLHATCRLTYSAVQRTINYVQLSSTIELLASCLQSVNLPVQCSWKICKNCTKSATSLYKNFCNVSLILILVHLATAFYVFDLRRFWLQLLQTVTYIMCVKLTSLLILQGECIECV